MTLAAVVFRRMRRTLASFGLGALIAASGVALVPAFAHHEAPASRTDGVPIPTLPHGQMRIIAQHFSEILDLADRQASADHTARRLRNYISLQYATCLWGIMPGSLADEASPFNECSHGYLSAAQALLFYIRLSPDVGPEADAVIDRIDREKMADDTALVLCRYSDEPFNTADVVTPHWNEVPSHLPSLLASIAFAGLIGSTTIAGALGLQLTGRRNAVPEPKS